MQPQHSVRILFSRRPTASSMLLRAFLWSEWSHCAVQVGDRVYEATAKHGVVEHTLAQHLEGTDRYHCIDVPLTQPQIMQLEVWAKSQIGKGYDWFGALGIAFRRNWEEDDCWFCSEYVAWLFQRVGRPLVNKPGWRITPPDLAQIVLQ